MDGFERFEQEFLPPKERFYNSLKDIHIKDEGCVHAETVFNKFGCMNLGDYHDLYLTTDALILADIFEAFRDTCMSNYGLDPAHSFTSPGLAWHAALKMSDVQLDLFTDIDIHLFFERIIRGGVATITHRYAKANNQYLDSYDPSKEKEFIIYLDANNLYGWAMSQSLPVGNFNWMNSTEDFDVMSIPDDGPQGYILEVDLG